MIKTLSMELVGFGDLQKKLHQDIQPEVINKKTGLPYDLKDPDFPVILDHKFRYRYWSMPKDSNTLIGYLKEHYEYFNRTRFNHKLKMPTIAILKDVSALKMRLRGVWRPGPRVLAFSPNLFNSPHEGWVNRILLHEMCHQYVTDFEGEEDVEGGHGPKWKSVMTKVGIPPNRYDYESNETYMDKLEKQRHAKAPNVKQVRLDSHISLTKSRLPVDKVTIGMNVLFVDPAGEIVFGTVNEKVGSEWVVEVPSKNKHYIVLKKAMFKPQE